MKNRHNYSRFFVIFSKISAFMPLLLKKFLSLITWLCSPFNKSFKSASCSVNCGLLQFLKISLKKNLLLLIFHHFISLLLFVRRFSVFFALKTSGFYIQNKCALFLILLTCKTMLKIFICNWYWWSSRSSAPILIMMSWFLITWYVLRIMWWKYIRLSSNHKNFVFFADFSHLMISFPRYMVIEIN